MEATDLLNNARFVLRTVEAEAVKANLDLPDRRYVTVGGSVFDCEQVTVSAMTLSTGVVSADSNPLSVMGACDPVWRVRYEVGIVVCASERMQGRRGDVPPSPEAIEEDTAKVSAAFAVLSESASVIAGGDTGPVQAEVSLGQPQGQLIAAVLSLTMNMWVFDDGNDN